MSGTRKPLIQWAVPWTRHDVRSEGVDKVSIMSCIIDVALQCTFRSVMERKPCLHDGTVKIDWDKFVPVPRQVGLAWPGAADVPARIKRGNYIANSNILHGQNNLLCIIM